ncbi:hypothetical protein PMIN03_011529 [Paraphaeosphaeria minitans]
MTAIILMQAMKWSGSVCMDTSTEAAMALVSAYDCYTAVFAYEPILKRLQCLSELPLEDQLLSLTPSSAEAVSGIQPTKVINAIRDHWEEDLQDIIGSTHSIKLDQAQADSLLIGLAKRISLIQGPPGTGKSFIGALVAKILHDHTNETMLILTYTNHALDQFLEDIQKAGIPASSIVRLGSKSNANTRALTIREQPNNYKMTAQTWKMIQDQKAEAECYYDALVTRMSLFASTRLGEQTLLDFLEFSDDSGYFDAFAVPRNKDGMTVMGKKNKIVDKYYLIKRWVKGDDAGVFANLAMRTYPQVWNVPPQIRVELQAQWKKMILEERVTEISALADKYNKCRAQIDRLFRKKNLHVISEKRIIGCTTTAAAMYTDEICKASPGIVLVEEAGEILESHTLTALTPTTKQLILIGDHKQLRPKINNYALTVEKGDGYDLNVSLFERLVLSGVPHTTLSKQHRIRPEISSLVRALTYPELKDAEKTQGRPDVRGFQSNVVFVAHSRPELNAVTIAGDIGFMSSPQRVNVLLSRARNGLIMIGNADTFMNSRKGKEVWVPLMDQLKRDGHVYDGFPVKCERHPDKTALLTEKEQFDETTRKCHDKAAAHCRKCEAEVRAREKKRQRDHKLDEEREAKQRAYAARLVEIEEEIQHQRRVLKEQAQDRERQQALQQKKQDLRNLQEKVQNPRKPPEPASSTSRATPTTNDSSGRQGENAAPNTTSHHNDKTTANATAISPDHDQDQDRNQSDWDKSEARDEWEWQKKYEGAEMEALDSLVPMIGLESVKQQFLAIKAKVDTVVRQNVSLKGERFGAALLGNPGTGKTTVARYYSKFLFEVGALPGGHFVESSGSALANDGVSACKAHIDNILQAGGGVFFIDEAYQLVSGNSPGGKAVLDYLLAEIENLTGKVVFVLAGYHKQMEAFFSHNPGIPSRIPIRMEFQDYEDHELQKIFCQYIDKKYSGRMKIEDELKEKPIVQYSLNLCFIGSPGTGKTSVAKLFGRILADIGLLSLGEVVVKNPADFVGNVIGGSEANTKAILASTVGKVLIIDEAYMLATASGPNGDPFKAAVIDTIVAEVQSIAGEDRCVLLLGYKDQMEDMFRDVNPGLARRFPLESAFVFEDFNDAEIRQIFDFKLRDIGFDATDQAKKVAMEVIQRARNRPNFGNAGEVDIILDRAKALHQKHVTSTKVKQFGMFEAIDFDPYFDRGERAATEVSALFQDVVGCESLIKQFQVYQTTAANMKALGMDAREKLPFNFLFKGPPGTGKTTTAAKMGKIFYDMGFLSQAQVVECSATDLIGQYVGQIGPKVQKLMGKAMGKVLFIDEAYRLAEGAFAVEAMDELVDCLTKPKFAQKLVVTLAGYDKDIDRLMSMNPGLTSRFPETVIFKHMEPETCLELLVKVLADVQKKKKAPLDFSVVDPPSARLRQQLLQSFRDLSLLESWGNARDVKSLAKSMFQALISTAVPPITSLILTEAIVIHAIKEMLDERSRRNTAAGTNRYTTKASCLANTTSPPGANNTNSKEDEPKPTEKRLEPEAEPAEPEDFLGSIFKAKRDPGISDEVWEQLERDKHAMVDKEREFRRLQEEKRQYEERVKEYILAEKAAADEEERRIREQARIVAELERRRREEEFAAIEKEREKEVERQKKLKKLGKCPMGYQWIKQASGYRCAGGSHTLSEASVDAFCR